MRVLFYLAEKHWSGVARALVAAARGLGARGHPITIACCVGTRLDHVAEELGFDRVAINAESWVASGSLDLRRVIKERSIDVGIVTAERDHLIVASAMRAAGRGAVLRRIPSFQSAELQRGGKLALRLAASGVIVSSRSELEGFAASGWSIPPAVVPLGVDPASFDATVPATRRMLQAPDQGTLVACEYDPSGRYRMGVVFRVLALLATRNRNIHVVVQGPGSRDDELRMHAAALGVGSLMSFLGERDDERAAMRAADAGWVVSGADAAAFACLDLMALRVPVIAARSALTERYVADGITGVLLSDDDPSITASALSTMLVSADRRLSMGNAGRSRVQREFLESVMIDSFEHAITVAADRTKRAK
jgi:glycosyltransferase involved in cell wall biosynthesis